MFGRDVHTSEAEDEGTVPLRLTLPWSPDRPAACVKYRLPSRLCGYTLPTPDLGPDGERRSIGQPVLNKARHRDPTVVLCCRIYEIDR